MKARNIIGALGLSLLLSGTALAGNVAVQINKRQNFGGLFVNFVTVAFSESYADGGDTFAVGRDTVVENNAMCSADGVPIACCTGLNTGTCNNHIGLNTLLFGLCNPLIELGDASNTMLPKVVPATKKILLYESGVANLQLEEIDNTTDNTDDTVSCIFFGT